MTPHDRALAVCHAEENERVVRLVERAVEEDRAAVDEPAMRVALRGGCCARHVALGRCVGGACGPLTRIDLEALATVAMDLRRQDYASEGLGAALLVVLATLSGRMP